MKYYITTFLCALTGSRSDILTASHDNFSAFVAKVPQLSSALFSCGMWFRHRGDTWEVPVALVTYDEVVKVH